MQSLLSKVKINSSFEYQFHFGHHFPDIDIFINGKKYGLELKSRNQLNWTTNGNSVFESITDEDYEEIYLLFGALDNTTNCYQVKFAPYWTVLSDIKVTHSPRFFIDMSLTNGNIFSSADEYNLLRNLTKEQKNQFLSKKLRNKTTESQWYLPKEETSVQPILLSSLTKDEKNRLFAELFILYGHDLLKSDNKQIPKADYEQAAAYIISQYFYYSPSFRDFFSAGGRFTYQNESYPRVFEILADNLSLIRNLLHSGNADFIAQCFKQWKLLESQQFRINNESVEKQFYCYLDRIGELYHSNLLGKKKLSSLLIEIHNSKQK